MRAKRTPTNAVRDAKAFCKRAKRIKAGRTIPADCRLPDSVKEIEAGRKPKQRQTELFDDGVMARLKSIKAAEVTR